EGRIFRVPQALPERRFLFRNHLQRPGYSPLDVHGPVRHCAHRRVGRALAGNGVGSAHENRPAPPALHRTHPTELPADRQALKMPAPVHSVSLALAALLLAAGVCARAAAGDALPEKNICADPAGPVALGSAQWNGWGRDLDNTRYQPEPAMRAADVPRLALKWAFGYQGSAVAGQPTIVDGRVFVASATGHVYSLDAKTGCSYWTFDAQTGVRTAVTIGELAAPKAAPRPKKSKRSKRTPAHLEVQKAPSAVFFGDDRGAVYALDAQKGRLLW